MPCAYATENDPLSSTLTSTCCLGNFDESNFTINNNPDNQSGVNYPDDTYCPSGQHRAFDSEISQQTIALQTVVFNTFVFCQVFNEVNSRKVNNDLNLQTLSRRTCVF